MALGTTMRHAVGSDSISLKVPGTRGLEALIISMVVFGEDDGGHLLPPLPQHYLFIRCRYLIEF